MGVGALSERLALIVDLNPEKAVAGFKTIGTSAEKELGKAQGSLDRMGGKLQTAGVGMIAFGAVALFTLEHFGQAAEKAELANLKLDNSIEHSKNMAGQSAKPFQDLAEKLQQTTEFSHVATTGMEAYLIQVGLTKDKVLALTPAIQDLAAKGEIPLDDAAKKVVLALNGKKKGLEALIGPLDATKYATDRYTAVTEALTRVQGFATREGKTFEGQLSILGNEFKQIEEGVGVGVVGAFQKMLSGVSGVTDGLNALSPSAQSTIGEVATFGAAGLVGIGIISTLAGTVLKARDNFSGLASMLGITTVATEGETIAAGEAEIANIGLAGAMGPIGVAGAGLVLIPILASLFAGETKSAGATEDYTKAIEKQTGAMTDNIDAVSSDKLAHSDAARAANDAGVTYKEMFAAIRTGTDDFGRYSEILKSSANDDTITIQGMHDVLVNAGASSTDFGRSLLSVVDSGKLSKDQLSGYAHLIEQLHNDYGTGMSQAEAYAAATGDAGGAAGAAAIKIAELDQNVKELHDQLHAQLDPLFAMEKATSDNAKAQADLITKQKDSKTSAADLADAQQHLAETAMGVSDASQTLAAGVLDGKISVDDAKGSLQQWVAQGLITQQSADDQAKKFDDLAWKALALGDINPNLVVTADISQAETMIARIKTDMANVMSGIFGVPRHAAGTNYFAGGLTHVNEQGGEILDLPTGTRIIPHDVSMAMAAGSSRAASGGDTHYHFTFSGPVLAEERYIIGLVERAMSNGMSFGPQTKRAIGNV